MEELKKAINDGNRIILDTALSKNNTNGFDIPEFWSYGGLWACKQPGSEENNCENIVGYHAVVVFGYDDKQKLLKIRNSWGNYSGHNGDYYMTYRYFYTMAVRFTIIK